MHDGGLRGEGKEELILGRKVDFEGSEDEVAIFLFLGNADDLVEGQHHLAEVNLLRNSQRPNYRVFGGGREGSLQNGGCDDGDEIS